MREKRYRAFCKCDCGKEYYNISTRPNELAPCPRDGCPGKNYPLREVTNKFEYSSISNEFISDFFQCLLQVD